MTEDVVIAVAEHRAILDGMSLALLLTVLVVGASLLLYFRSPAALAALLGSLAVGTLATFGVVRLTIGHLNSVTAFLSSIVVGNGINFGIIVLARYLEERRRPRSHAEALARALGGSFTGTLAAALAAAIAYASLIITDFRGFRDFGDHRRRRDGPLLDHRLHRAAGAAVVARRGGEAAHSPRARARPAARPPARATGSAPPAADPDRRRPAGRRRAGPDRALPRRRIPSSTTGSACARTAAWPATRGDG